MDDGRPRRPGAAPRGAAGDIRRLAAGIASGACIWDADLRLVAWNDAYCRILKVSPGSLRPGTAFAEVVDRTAPMLDNALTGAEVEANMRALLPARGGLEVDRVHTDGTVVSVTYHPLADGGWMSLYRDVTEQRRDINQLRDKARALKEQNLRVDAALESMPYGFSVWDADCRLLLFNRRYAEIYGMPIQKLRVGMTLREVCEVTVAAGNHPGVTVDELFRIYRDRLRGVSPSGRAGEHEKVIKGRTIKTTYVNRPGLGCVVTHEDISGDRARLEVLRDREAALEQQKLRLESAVNTMSHGLCMFDRDMRLVICNDQYARLYGLPPELLKPGTPLKVLLEHRVESGVFPAGERETYVAQRMALAQNGEPNQHVVQMSNGRYLRVTHQPMSDGGWVATQEDVTDSIQHLRDVEDREAALQHEKLRLEAAVNNMTQGLCMFDADRRLVICNDNYATIYGLPPELMRPGTPLEDILAWRYEHGVHPAGSRQTYFDRRVELIERGKSDVDVVELQDGRTLSVIHQPMADGGWVSTHQDITEQRNAEARIRYLARHDSLTDLPNRLMFREIMETAESRLRRGEVLALLAIDLDHFKTVNDTLGHGIGDVVLTKVAARLRESCREVDTVARLGGDEFAVLTGTLASPGDAATLANRIVTRAAEPLEVDGHSIVIGASVGIAVAPGDGNDAETLLKNADLALYRAKNDGRGAYHFFERGMDASLQERRALELALRQALARNEFRLVFQPLFNLKEGKICGLEALLRWYHPERGTIAPSDFVPIAEDAGLIVPIGEWVLREACLAAAGWPDDIHVAVNLSTVQFRNRKLYGHVKAALDASGLNPGRLELEVTEALLVVDSEATMRTLHELRRLGVRIAMDDFGTGYSSLSYLRSFPFDKIKIDRSFVADMSEREDSRAIVNAVIGLGRSLGMSTAAEGVETEAQLDIVRDQGCTEVQGFLLSPPLPGSAVTRLFAESAGMEEWTRTLRGTT